MVDKHQFQQKHHKGVKQITKEYNVYMKALPLPNNIGPFMKHTKEPKAIQYGTLYNLEVEVDVPYEKKRMLRVYLPEDYDGKKKYPVMYMTDAQNAVDKYLTAYGEWDIDEHMHELLEKGYKSFIIAGLDCPKRPINRAREYVLDKAHLKGKILQTKGYGMKYAKYMVDVIKPLVDKYFQTLPDKQHTAFGGSSMGGLCSFDIVSLFPDTFSFALTFSPAFFVLNRREYQKEIKSRLFKINEQKFFFFTGKLDLDAKIHPGTVEMYEYMKSLGYDDEHVALIVDENMGHHESSWSHYFNDATMFWQK